MAAAVWAIRTFADHLQGQCFVLFTDHRPLQKVALAPSKVFNDFQLLGLEFNFITQYKKGINMLADFLSRADSTLVDQDTAEVHLVELLPRDMKEEQHRWADIAALKQFRSTGHFPSPISPVVKYRLTTLNKNITTDRHGRFWIRTESGKYPRNVLYAPASL
jgi:hypothetical protein